MDQQKMQNLIERIKKTNMSKVNPTKEQHDLSNQYSPQYTGYDWTDCIISFMILAEGLDQLSGEQKKEYVLKCVEDYACQKNEHYDRKRANILIERLIDLTKMVN